jgi:hypothetical protein
MVVVLVIVVLIVLIVLAGLALRRSETETITFPAPVGSVDVKLPAGGVRITAGGDGGASVTREMRWLVTKPKLDERMDGDELHLHVTGSPLFSGVVEYSMTVPAGASVKVWSSAGTIHATGIDGEVDARSSAGGIYVDGCGGALRLRTSAGSVEGERLSSTDVEVHSSAGGVDLTFSVAPARVEVETSAGSVDVVVPDDRYAVSTDTGVGSQTVEVTRDDTSGRRIAVKTSAGSVRIAKA